MVPRESLFNIWYSTKFPLQITLYFLGKWEENLILDQDLFRIHAFL